MTFQYQTQNNTHAITNTGETPQYDLYDFNLFIDTDSKLK